MSSLTGVSLLTLLRLCTLYSSLSPVFYPHPVTDSILSLSSGWLKRFSFTPSIDQLSLFFQLSSAWPVYMERRTFILRGPYMDTHIHTYAYAYLWPIRNHTPAHNRNLSHRAKPVNSIQLVLRKVNLYCWICKLVTCDCQIWFDNIRNIFRVGECKGMDPIIWFKQWLIWDVFSMYLDCKEICI